MKKRAEKLFSNKVTAVTMQQEAQTLDFLKGVLNEAISNVQAGDFLILVPAVVAILMTPLSYSIADGLMLTTLAWTLCNRLKDHGQRERVSPMLIGMNVLAILRFAFITV